MKTEQLKHQLKSRHLQMIALGGAIGSGLFLGTAKSIHSTGPSLLLSYIIYGAVIYIILRALGEMTVEHPSSGSFSEYAHRYLGNYAGFITGWSAWFEYTVVCMVELTAASIFLDYLIPGIPHWIFCLVTLAFFTIINILSVKIFGEFEFWFAGIKIVAIIAMILFSIYIIFFHNTINPNLSQYLNKDLFFAGGISGLLVSFVLVVFSFGGSEFISIAAAEAENPRVTVPKAINGFLIRIILFYVLTVAVIIVMYPYEQLSTDISPFVDVFEKIGINKAALIMKLVVLTTALSAFNSCLYSASRMLYNLSSQGYALKTFAEVQKNTHTPIKATLASSATILITVYINYLFPEKAFIYLLTVVTTAILIVWFIILITHFFFRIKINKSNTNSSSNYKLILFPYSNIFAICALVLVVFIMTRMEDMKLSVFITPIWMLFLTIFYIINKRIKK